MNITYNNNKIDIYTTEEFAVFGKYYTGTCHLNDLKYRDLLPQNLTDIKNLILKAIAPNGGQLDFNDVSRRANTIKFIALAR